ncbi:uncharacterized protein K460DRAFT_285727 [Cucurbitaria berberidis CBS 394.84]|uniref:F-box domain-containing protein n=1 Tax=Cucurbitaria berberidis CBS 394.84 TaxID=1168544 RepID=A0A9P4GIB9_9PLEO|nr:uncharacterized protein K460DRAFT_285727 [Cucurbitaria berberidis CBS 394.84]KAF1846708.1 hypothetical protein K460DRAFT_285727 [Cucurbitaria berberidis CBS 394.84]
MVPPSYARATASSTLRAGLNSSKAKKAVEVPKGTPKKLKRPSTLTIKDRQEIIYSADLHPIKPLNAKKPCPLATLPSELRTEIYTYVLDQASTIIHPQQFISPRKDRPPCYIWPRLLHICRAIRIEAAYTYYTSTPFTWTVRNLNFAPVIAWIDTLPREHRALLPRNRCMKLDIIPRISNHFAYPPSNYLIDAPIESHWKACERFGNLFAVSGDQHRKHFIIFCRLGAWWLWCDKYVNRNIQWTYLFCKDWAPNGLMKHYRRRSLLSFLEDHVSVLMAPCVRKAWIKNTGTAGMRKEASRMLEALDIWYMQIAKAPTDQVSSKWREKMGLIKGVVEKW